MLATAALFTLTLYCASGIGRLLLGSAPVGGPFRTTVAHYVVGSLFYSALFGLAFQLGVGFTAFSIVAVLAGLVGLATCLVIARQGARLATYRLALAVGAGLVFLVCGVTPTNLGAADSLHYAYIVARVFHDDWFASRVPVIPDRAWLAGLLEEVAVTRGPTVALLWPSAALGGGLGAETVTQLGMWFLVLGLLLSADVLAGLAPLLVCFILALGGLGAFNATSIVTGGQLNQAFALAAALAAVWICRHATDRRTRLVTLFLAGNVIAGGYPEFLLAAPVYLACAALVKPEPLRARIAEIAIFALGAAIVLGTTRLGIIRYLLYQRSAAPGWSPLPNAPADVADAWRIMLFQNVHVWWVLPAALIAGLFVMRAMRRRMTPAAGWPLAILAAVGVTLMLGIWSWAVMGAGNGNYATFKLGGWLGPGLVLIGWLLAGYARPAVQPLLLALILTAALVRGADLVISLQEQASSFGYPGRERPTWRVGDVARGGVPCTLELRSDRAQDLMRAASQSAAPVRGCEVIVRATAAG